MTTLETKAGTAAAIDTTPKQADAPAKNVDTATLITEQQVLFASAATLAPTPARHHHAHEFAAAVRAMFARAEKSHTRRHYPQRFSYLESSAMSREMYRL